MLLGTYMIEAGFSGKLPTRTFYYTSFIVILSPIQILIYSMFYKDYAYDYRFRIFGHYKSNFSFEVIEQENVVIECLAAITDWLFVFVPFEVMGHTTILSVNGG